MSKGSFAVISFCPKLGEFRIANIGVPLLLSWRAKDGLASIDGEEVKAFFNTKCLILKKSQTTRFGWIGSREDLYFSNENTAFWVMLKVVG
jgi:hypothetical protein